MSLSFKSVSVFIILAMPSQAYAYLDPNSGSILLQVLLGGLAGVALSFRMFWENIKGFFSFGRRKEAEPETEDAAAND
jgi:hypothetical protein